LRQRIAQRAHGPDSGILGVETVEFGAYRPVVLSVILACFFATGFTPGGAARAQGPIPWRHGVVQPQGDAGLRWMTAEGGFAARQGLAMRMVAFDNEALMFKALIAGEVETIEGSPIGAMIATSKGGDLKIVGCSWPKLAYSFFAHQGIGSLANLRGKTIGISARGALSEFIARAMLGRVAIEARDVKFVELGNDAARIRAVADRAVDATVASSDFAVRAELGLKNLSHANDILPNFVSDCIVTRGDLWRKRFDDLVGLLTATMNAYDHALTHRTDTVALARRIARFPGADAIPATNFDEVIKNRSISPTLDLDITKLLWLRDFLADEGFIDADFEPGTMIDRSARERALARVKGQ
jgi:NitT/TauT family transport system substrate-binding protein